MVSVMIFGLPMEEVGGMPYVTTKVEEPIATGVVFTLGEKKFAVVKADPVTQENQLQYVYVELAT